MVWFALTVCRVSFCQEHVWPSSDYRAWLLRRCWDLPVTSKATHRPSRMLEKDVNGQWCAPQDKVFYLFVEDFSTNTTNGVEVTDYPRHFELNEPMGAFLGVIALIFALLYNSIFNDAQQRLASIRTNLAQEAGAVHTAALLVRTLDSKDSINKTRALLLFSDYIECLNIELVEKKSKRIRCGQSAMRSSSTSSIESQGLSSDPEDGLMDGSAKSNIETLYAAVPFLSKIGSDGEGDEMDRVLVQRTVDSVSHRPRGSCCPRRADLESNIVNFRYPDM